jgi:hypothetical protein
VVALVKEYFRAQEEVRHAVEEGALPEVVSVMMSRLERVDAALHEAVR